GRRVEDRTGYRGAGSSVLSEFKKSETELGRSESFRTDSNKSSSVGSGRVESEFATDERLEKSDFVFAEEGSIAQAVQKQGAEEYGVDTFVISDEAWQKIGKKAPAYTRNGQIYLRENLSQTEKAGLIPHEASHVMKQKNYTPYVEFVNKLPEKVNLSSEHTQKVFAQVAEHLKFSGIDLSSKQETDFWDEFNATIYGSMQIAKEQGIDCDWVLGDVFHDLDGYLAEMDEIHGKFKVENKSVNPIDSVASAVNQSREGARLAVTLGENGAKAFRTVYTPEIARTVPSDVAMDGFRAIYNSAVTGKDMTDGQKAAAMKIPKIMQDIAFDSGKLDAQRAAQATYFGRDSGLIRDDSFKKANLKSRDIRILDAIAKVTGTQIRFVDTINEGSDNASYGKGVISISLDSDDPVRVAMMHEVIHRLKEISPESYRKLSDFVFNNLTADELEVLQEDFGIDYSELSPDGVGEEIVAQAFGVVMGDKGRIDAFIRENRGTWEKICDIIKDLIISIRRALSGERAAQISEYDREAFSGLLKKAEEMERVLREALETADTRFDAKAEKSTAGAVKSSRKSSAKYALRTDAETEVDKAISQKGYQNEVRLTDSSPDILLSQKGVKDLPLVMKATHIRENILTEEEAKSKGFRTASDIHYHGLGKELFLQVIEGLNDVSEAYRGTKNAENPARRENYFLLISKCQDEDGNTINVPVYVNEHAQYNKVFIDTNKIATVFGRQGFKTYINNQIAKGNLVRIKNRSLSASEPTPLIDEG
ncbi:MAG: hypothetical protein IJO61_04295, partial [Oscillospiraceae bacterium]|nr:hypothetical protein [Oscillospiraceae bacterium]